MDDDLEDEIIWDFVYIHAQFLWKCACSISTHVVNSLIPGPGESYKTMIFQPIPFMVSTFIFIIVSVLIQNDVFHFQRLILKCHKFFIDKKIHNFVQTVSSSTEDNSWQTTRQGIAGVSAIQGRRGTMEDRYCMMQDVDVGNGRKLSFFGVYDGHGGQYVAEYVRQNLFVNTINKIREHSTKKPVEEFIISPETRRTSVPASFLHSEINEDTVLLLQAKLEAVIKSMESNPENGEQDGTNECEESMDDSRITTDSKDDSCPKTNACDINPTKSDTSPKISDTSPKKSDTSPKKSDISPNKSDASPNKTDTSPNKSDTSPKKSDVSPNKSDTSPKKSDASPNKTDTSPNKTDTSPNKTDTRSKKSDTVDSKSDDTCKIGDLNFPVMKDDPYSAANLRKRNSLPTDVKIKESEAKNDIYIDSQSNINYTKLLTDQINEIDNKVVEHCKSHTDLSGSTAIIAILDGELLIIGNVGDSRAVMGDMNGTAIPLSFDHKPNQLKERRRINHAGGCIVFNGVWRVAGVLATSRAVGDYLLKHPRKLVTAEPDVLTFSLKEHKAHFVILATDGLWDVMSNEDAVDFVRKRINDYDYGAQALVKHAFAKGSQDNITVVVLNIAKMSKI